MKKITLLLLCFLSALVALAQSNGDFYVDMLRNNVKYDMDWDASKGCYTVKVSQLEGDFKIYSKDYVPGQNNQDHLIYGSADGFNGVYVGYDKNLSNPGNNLCIEGGGILYNAVLEFYPGNPAIFKITEGTKEPPAATDPTVSVKITSATGDAPTVGTINYDISMANIDSPATLIYGIYAVYDSQSKKNNVVNVTTGQLTGNTLKLIDLEPATTTPVTLYVVTFYDNQTLSNNTEGSIKTPAIPILIGQLAEGSWKPNIGVEYSSVSDDGMVYTYYPTFVENGEFSFVSKLGNNDSDWTTVNSADRYAPGSQRKPAPDSEWTDYNTYSGSTTNSWVPENFNSAFRYHVDFDFATKQIKVTGFNLTGVEDIEDIEDSAMPASVDVYSAAGTLMRSNAPRESALQDLPAGLYIAGGKKFIVK